jgi:hypothetical protein
MGSSTRVQQESVMKRILALAFAAGMIVALAPTDADAQRGGRGGGGGGMGGGGFAGGMGGGGFAGGMGGGGFPGGMGGGGQWAGGMGGGGQWAGGGRNWRGNNWRPGWGWGAGAAALGAATYPWGYGGYEGYGAYASEDDSCMQQRTVRRGGVYRTIWVNVC